MFFEPPERTDGVASGAEVVLVLGREDVDEDDLEPPPREVPEDVELPLLPPLRLVLGLGFHPVLDVLPLDEDDLLPPLRVVLPADLLPPVRTVGLRLLTRVMVAPG